MKTKKMKTILLHLFIVVLTSFTVGNTTAQVSPTESLYTKKEIAFPPLTVLLDSAIKHSAMVDYRKYDVEAKKANVTTQRNAWLRNVGIQGDSRYGTLDAFSTNANGVTTNFSSTSSQQLNYAFGVYLKLPVFEIVNRKTQIKHAKAEVEAAKSMQLAQVNEIRQLVIRQYQEVLLRQKLLVIKSQNLGSANVNIEMVEKEFKNGIIPIAEYVRLSDMTARIQAEYEMALSEFVLSKKMLEEIVGFTFSNP
jgi:outer membrane protein TolC